MTAREPAQTALDRERIVRDLDRGPRAMDQRVGEGHPATMLGDPALDIVAPGHPRGWQLGTVDHHRSTARPGSAPPRYGLADPALLDFAAGGFAGFAEPEPAPASSSATSPARGIGSTTLKLRSFHGIVREPR